MDSIQTTLSTSIDVSQNVRLADYTTMKVGGVAKYFALVTNDQELPLLVRWAQQKAVPFMVLGGGSNIVFSDKPFEGLVIKLENKDVSIIENNSEKIVVRADAGLNWDAFVEYCVDNGWWGVENMSLIPGTVGAVAVQNVSAYGQEAKNVILSVSAYDTYRGRFTSLSNEDCKFGFRESVFNKEAAGRYIICSIDFHLRLLGSPCLNRSDVAAIVSRYIDDQCSKNIADVPSDKSSVSSSISILDVRAAVVAHRSSGTLLPLPGTLGNSGTFFRASVTPLIDLPWLMLRSILRGKAVLAAKIFGCAVKYRSHGSFKLPSRMLIESCGLSQYKNGNFHLYKNNCAVVVSEQIDNLSAEELIHLVSHVRGIVYREIGVLIPIEPLLVNFDAPL